MAVLIDAEDFELRDPLRVEHHRVACCQTRAQLVAVARSPETAARRKRLQVFEPAVRACNEVSSANDP